MRQILFMLAAFAFSSSIAASWLPGWFDMPRRDNPHDYMNQRPVPVDLAPALPTFTITPTPLGTFTQTPVPGPATWNFDGATTEGWVRDTTGDTAFTAMAANAGMPYLGANGLDITANFITPGSSEGGAIFINSGCGLPLDLSAGIVLSAWVYVPAGMSPASPSSGVFFFVKTGPGYSWNQGTWTNLPAAGGWTQVTYNLSAVPGNNDVREIGIKIGLGGCPACSGWGPGTIYIDEINISGYTCPGAGTPTPSFTYSPTPVPGSPTFTATLTQTPTLTPTFSFSPSPVPGSPTSTPTPCVSAAQFNFDAGTVQGWMLTNPGVSGVMSTTNNPDECSHSLEFTADLTDANGSNEALLGVDMSGADLTGATITARLWIPAGMSDGSFPSGGYLYVQSGGWNWTDAGWFNLPSTAGWLTLTYDLSAVPGAAAVDRIGLKLGRGAGAPEWTGIVYLDQVAY